MKRGVFGRGWGGGGRKSRKGMKEEGGGRADSQTERWKTFWKARTLY